MESEARTVKPAAENGQRSESKRDEADAFRLLVDSIQEYAIFFLDPKGHVITWNAGAQRIKGYTPEEIIGKHFSEFYPAEARESGWPQRELELAIAEGRFADEGWRVRKGGTTFWASVLITALRDKNGELYGFGKVTRDLSERRDREEKIQQLNSELRSRLAELNESKNLVEARTVELQNLSARLLQSQDDERRRIARELHDSVGQELAAVKMTIGSVRDKDKALEALKKTAEMVDSTIKSVRTISYLLHPPLLDEVGLLAAIHWLVDGLRARSGLQVQLVIRPTTFARLPRDIEATIYRVLQEALTNVYRHSESTAARVEIDQQPHQVVLKVRDYGRGFFTHAANESPTKFGVGMSGMRERVKQFGGEFKVSSAEPGTLVEAVIPLFAI